MAIQLLGDGGNVGFDEAIIGDRTTFTFEFWIKPSWPTVDGAPNPYRNAIYGESHAADGIRHTIQILSEDASIPGHVLGSLACTYWVSPDVEEVFTDPLQEDVWQHVAVVRDGPTLRLYVDGVLHDEGNAQAYGGPVPSVFRIGNNFGSSYGKFVMDDLRVSSTARYRSNFMPPRVHAVDAVTLSLWRFDETSGPTTSDETGNHANGVVSATVQRVLADR